MSSSYSSRRKTPKKKSGNAMVEEFPIIPPPTFLYNSADSHGNILQVNVPIQGTDDAYDRPLKRPRSQTLLPDDDVSHDTFSTVHMPNPPNEPHSGKAQGASTYMNEFKDNLHVLLDYLLLQESSPDIGKPCPCGAPNAVRTCLCFECSFFEPCCPSCFLKSHSHSPLHWSHVWNGKFFEKKDICSLGYIYTFSHKHGQFRCPVAEATGAYDRPKDFILVDTNGIHEIHCVFCACIGRGKPEDHFTDLLASRIFPATVLRPETGFTFNLLWDFHLHTLTSKKSPYDYLMALRRKTCNFSPNLNKVPDPYHQFLRVQRVFRVVQELKRSGHAHGMDQFFPNRPPGSVIVPCLACPEPGFNVPNRYWTEVEDDFIHIIQLTMMIDGHFGLQRFNKVDDPDDVSLLDGLGFFPRDEEYNAYVKNIVFKTDDEKSTCARLHAVDMQNKLKFKGCVITGVVAAECGRHCVFLSMADLQKGERFANADYVVMQAIRRYTTGNSLNHAQFFRRILCTYDIACQFEVHFFERTRKHFPDMAWLIDFVRWLIPKMHLDGHKLVCRIRYSLNYLKGAGRTHGEGIEQSWAESKQSGGSTRQMNHGHRHDTIIDFHNYWNWVKAENMGSALEDKYWETLEERNKAIEYYIGLSNMRGKDRVESWSKENDEPRLRGNEWTSVYHTTMKRLPSRQAIYMNLLNNEREKNTAKGELYKDTSDDIQFIWSGMQLQERQRQLKVAVKRASTDSEVAAVKRSKTVLASDLRQWRKIQLDVMTQIENITSNQHGGQPIEDECLYLPSDFSEEDRKRLSLDGLAKIELTLREGECNDAIVDLCDSINYKIVMRDTQRTDSHGVTQNTRSLRWLNSAESKKQGYATQYRVARVAILGLLGLPDSRDYPLLEDEHMYAKNSLAPREIGDGKKTDSWIWRYGRLKGLDDKGKAEFITEAERVQWFRAKADMERLIEEIEILEEEFRRLLTSCQSLSLYWSQLSDHPPDPLFSRYRLTKSVESFKDGPQNPYRVYAAQKSALYDKMAKETERKFQELGGCWPGKTEDLNTFFRRQRPTISVDWN